MSQFETVNPATEEKIAVYENMTEAQILSKIEKLETGYQIWRLKTISERIEFLTRFKGEMQKRLPELSLLITQTMGKPLLEFKLEIEKSISQIDYYINFGPELIQPRQIAATGQTKTVALHESKGFFVSPRFVLIDKAALAIEKYYDFFQEEEVFSPLGMVVTYDNDNQLQKLVEGSPFGLGLVCVGMIAVNDILMSDPRVPFGGVKNTGFGRESGEFGIREFCNVQTVGFK